MKHPVILLLLGIAAVLALLLFSITGAKDTVVPPAPEEMPIALADQYDSLTIAYSNPERGYSVRYPVGYPIESIIGGGVSFYSVGPSGMAETFVFNPVSSNFTALNLKDAAADLDARIVSEGFVSANGKKAVRIEYVVPSDQWGEELRLVQGLVPCDGYSLLFVASIPESLRDDVSLADYSLYTAKC